MGADIAENTPLAIDLLLNILEVVSANITDVQQGKKRSLEAMLSM